MKQAKKTLSREWKAVVVLDAPGITGRGSNSLAKMTAHVAASGKTMHPYRVRCR